MHWDSRCHTCWLHALADGAAGTFARAAYTQKLDNILFHMSLMHICMSGSPAAAGCEGGFACRILRGLFCCVASSDVRHSHMRPATLRSEMQVADVLYNAQLQYLLVVLQDALTKQQMEQLAPDIEHAHRAARDGSITGVIVAAHARGAGALPHDGLHEHDSAPAQVSTRSSVDRPVTSRTQCAM